MTVLSAHQRRWLRQRVHQLRPVVTVGQHGLTEAVIKEIDLALAHHELIKIRMSGADREERDELVARIADRSGSQLINRIGHVAAFFRANPRLKDRLPLPEDDC